MGAFFTRAEWGARPPKSRSTNIAPAHVTAHWAGPSPWRGGPMDPARSASLVRGIQAFHMDGQGWSDIAYTSLIDPWGNTFEGRGPGVRTAANGSNDGNQRSYAVCYLAGVGDPLTEPAKHAFLREAQRLGQPLDRVHSDWFSTSCPGDELRAWIRPGAPAPGPGTGPVLPPSQAPIDWPAVRRFAAAVLAGQVALLQLVSAGGGREQVRVVQKALNLAADAGLAEDGVWGPKTDRAVRSFQRFFKLQVDGVVGPRTRDTLRYVLDRIAHGQG